MTRPECLWPARRPPRAHSPAAAANESAPADRQSSQLVHMLEHNKLIVMLSSSYLKLVPCAITKSCTRSCIEQQLPAFRASTAISCWLLSWLCCRRSDCAASASLAQGTSACDDPLFYKLWRMKCVAHLRRGSTTLPTFQPPLSRAATSRFSFSKIASAKSLNTTDSTISHTISCIFSQSDTLCTQRAFFSGDAITLQHCLARDLCSSWACSPKRV